jgi:magnesium chelatase
MKVINLPISATEDRVVGTLDIEHAIKTGEKKFEKGLLAQSNRNILYVDEINLLDDHIVDVLLDSAAMGVNTIEREGISYSHPAKFVLVGTMNPEEGDLRPQLLDRFGLVVDVIGERETSKRVEVIKRRLDFEAEPEKFIKKYLVEEEELKNRIENSKKRLNNIKCSDEIYELAAKISIALNVDGHRADIAVVKTAMTIAAFENREEVIKEDILRAAVLALPHRMRKTPFEDGILDEEQIEKLVNSLTM